MVSFPTTSPSAPQRITPLGWALRGLGLLAVSVVSGLVWLAFNPAEKQSPTPGQQGEAQPKHDFTTVRLVDGYQSCADVSTDDIKKFFIQHGCEHLTRALYTTTLPSDQRVLTSVVTVRMADPATARQLNNLVTRDATGNVKDLVSDGQDVPDEFPSLQHDFGYDSEQQGKIVVVGESAYFNDPEHEDAALRAVTTDALKLAKKQDTN